MQLAQGLLPLATAALYRANSAAKQTELQRATDALRTQHPELVTPAETKGGALVAAAKNLRTQLRKAFPGVKFSVTTDRFSGGDSLRVTRIGSCVGCERPASGKMGGLHRWALARMLPCPRLQRS